MAADVAMNQIDNCSNAIVGFSVLQGVAYSYALGTNATFNCYVKTATHLADGMSIALTFVGAFMLVGIVLLGREARKLAGDHTELMRKLYTGKFIAVLIFAVLPLVLTLGYGVRDYPGKANCLALQAKP